MWIYKAISARRGKLEPADLALQSSLLDFKVWHVTNQVARARKD